MEESRNTLAEHLINLQNHVGEEGISLEYVLHELAGRGHALILVLFSLPFCLPVQIPGFSTFFGLVLAFIGLRVAFGHRAWIPKSLLQKKVSKQNLQTITSAALKVTQRIQFFVRTRWTWMFQNPVLNISHGLTIALMAMILALPLPIPLTNMLSALPILFFGLGLLEDDGVMIAIAYGLSLFCLVFFAVLFWLGKEGVMALLG